jgi:hypothetical protein
VQNASDHQFKTRSSVVAACGSATSQCQTLQTTSSKPGRDVADFGSTALERDHQFKTRSSVVAACGSA